MRQFCEGAVPQGPLLSALRMAGKPAMRTRCLQAQLRSSGTIHEVSHTPPFEEAPGLEGVVSIPNAADAGFGDLPMGGSRRLRTTGTGE